MERAKTFAKQTLEKLEAHEELINKLQEVLLFNGSIWQGIVLILLANALYITFTVLGFNTYSGLAIIVAFIALFPIYIPIIGAILLPKQISADGKRFELKQIAATVGSAYFMFVSFLSNAKLAIDHKMFIHMMLSIFGLMFAFFLFLSIPDYILGLLLMNTVFLTPFFVFKFDKEAFNQKLNNLKAKISRNKKDD